MLYVVTWLTDFAAFLLVFTVPRQLAEAQAPPWTLGLIGALFSACSACSNLIGGRLSDRFGRRGVAVTGTILLLAALVGASRFDPSHWTFLGAFGLGGTAVGMIYPPIIASLSQGRRGRAASRAFLGFCLAFNLGMVSGQLLGGWLFDQRGSDAPLLAGIGLSLLSLILILGGVDRFVSTNPQADERPRQRTESAALAPAFARLGWVANFGGTFSVSIVFFLLPRLVVSLGIASTAHGIILALSRVIVIATFFSMHVSKFWHYRFSTSLGAQLLAVAGLIWISVADSAAGLVLGLSGLSVLLGYNYFSSLYYSTTGSAEEKRGRASGIHEATLALGLTGGSLAGGLAGETFGNRAPFLLAAAVIGGLVIAQTVLYRWLVVPLRRRLEIDRSSDAVRASAGQTQAG